jgi:hypothetical protein
MVEVDGGYDFDHFVDALISEWEWVEEIAEEWPTLDGEERASIMEDWPSNTQMLLDLRAYVSEHRLTQEQKAKYNTLRSLIARNRPALVALGFRLPPVAQEALPKAS